MKKTWRWRWLLAASLVGGLTSLTGCQTWFGGMTLPSPWYLKHPPQYFLPGPAFPLQRELASMDDQAKAAQPQAVPVGGPIIPPAAP